MLTVLSSYNISPQLVNDCNKKLLVRSLAASENGFEFCIGTSVCFNLVHENTDVTKWDEALEIKFLNGLILN